jgi:hypothetical protein
MPNAFKKSKKARGRFFSLPANFVRRTGRKISSRVGNTGKEIEVQGLAVWLVLIWQMCFSLFMSMEVLRETK